MEFLERLLQHMWQRHTDINADVSRHLRHDVFGSGIADAGVQHWHAVLSVGVECVVGMQQHVRQRHTEHVTDVRGDVRHCLHCAESSRARMFCRFGLFSLHH